ncbi:MAG: BlaI/MecI/CopY family transcriptional regulator [Lachnospiraceae bacterium]|nr:BlaI/MecI/CopY family transcriptional regulator [Lachnospiraceae bacterium]
MSEKGMKLFDSERKVMEVLWEYGDMRASGIVKVLKERIGWNRNTTYTVVKKCVEKGAIKRIEPHFVCQALVSKEDIQEYETKELVNRMFDGSKEKFFAAFLDKEEFSDSEITHLKELVQKLK